MGEKALRGHADGKKHKKMLGDHEQVKKFFKPKNVTDITKESNKTSEAVIITAPVDFVSAATVNHLMSVVKTQLAKRLKL